MCADDIVLGYQGASPYVIFIKPTVHDSSCNNNGLLDRGETADLTCAIMNIGGVVLNNASATLLCSDPSITIIDNYGYYGTLPIDSICENIDNRFTVSADINTPSGHSAEFKLIVTDGSYVDTSTFCLQIGMYDYLVWNPDRTPASGQTIDSILTSLGYQGNCVEYLPIQDLHLNQAIFVCVGVYPKRFLIVDTSREATALVDYLDSGGKMYLEGGEVWFWDPIYGGYDFGPLFGIQGIEDGDSIHSAIGFSGTFTAGMDFVYAGDNSFLDIVDATGTGFRIFMYADTNYICGVANDAGIYRTVGASFELGGLVDAAGVSTRAVLLDSIMHFFGIFQAGAVEESKDQALAPVLHVFPNPFSNSTTINLGALDTRAVASIRIYDITGRLIKSLTPQSTICNLKSSMVWDGRDDVGNPVPAGIYFCRLESDGYEGVEKIIKIK